jgi:hypothetical protein
VGDTYWTVTPELTAAIGAKPQSEAAQNAKCQRVKSGVTVHYIVYVLRSRKSRGGYVGSPRLSHTSTKSSSVIKSFTTVSK